MVAWIHGGPSAGENIQAWCADCNLRLGPHNAEGIEGLHFRQWQAAAFPVILRELYQTGSATLHAAPGAGKTLFAVAVYKQLRDEGLAERVVVVVPNLAIVEQWKDAFARLQIHLDIEPRDGHLEHPDTDGCVITYQRLGQPEVAGAHTVDMGRQPTFVIFDEVHHLAEKASWGNAAEVMTGDVANGHSNIHAAAVLNMTGTLFRSSKNKRISTVKYDRVTTDDGEKWQARATWSIPTKALIGSELRPVDLWSYSSHAELVDLRTEEVISGEVADLDKQQMKAVIRGQLDKKPWLKGFAAEALRMLENQRTFVDEPLKLLFVANSRDAARRAADAINETDGTGKYAFLSGEFDYFLSNQGIHREDVIRVPGMDAKGELEKHMDERRTGEDGYRRPVLQARAENAQRPGQPIEPFGLTEKEAKALAEAGHDQVVAHNREALGAGLRRLKKHGTTTSAAASLPQAERLRRSALRLSDDDLADLIDALKQERRRRQRAN